MTALKYESVALASVELDADNVRTHSQRNIDSIKHSLEMFGQVKPIVLHGKIVIAGNGTVMAARELGWDSINAVTVPSEWTKRQAQAYAVADNRTAELASWDDENLLALLSQFDQVTLEAVGFTDADLRALTAIYGDIPEGYEGRVDEPDTTPTTGKVISLRVSDDTFDRWKEMWDLLGAGSDDAKVNEILDVMP